MIPPNDVTFYLALVLYLGGLGIGYFVGRERYRKTYKAGAAVIRKSLLPERLPYMAANWRITKMELLARGRKVVEDKEVEYQELRVFVEEVEDAPKD